MAQNNSEYTRKQFSSKWIFILAAVGSAAGLGNVWRFPYLAYENGGGSFFIAYLVCLFLIGLPFLIMECGLGQLTKRSAPGAMAKTTRSGTFRFVGWIAILTSLVILSYYTIIASWTLNYAFYAPSLPWEVNSSDFFFTDFLQLSKNISLDGNFVPGISFGAAAIYILVFYTMRKGTSGIEKIATLITPIPFVLLIVLAINSLTLKGASTGLDFIFIPKWDMLWRFQTWFAAASQVFFSLSIGFGVMFAYGSLLNQKVNIKSTAIMVVFGDTFVSVVGSIVVFGVLGYMAQKQGVPVDQVVKSGIALAFVVIPKALSLLPYFKYTLSTFFYVSLFCLAFTSIISIIEAMTAGLMEAKIFHLKRTTWVLLLCFLEFGLGCFYMEQNGLYILDIVDHFVSGYNLMFVGLLETILIGWGFGAKRFRSELHKHSGARLSVLYDYLIKYFLPVVLLLLLCKQIIDEFAKNYGSYATEYLAIYGLGILILILILGIAVAKVEKKK